MKNLLIVFLAIMLMFTNVPLKSLAEEDTDTKIEETVDDDKEDEETEEKEEMESEEDDDDMDSDDEDEEEDDDDMDSDDEDEEEDDDDMDLDDDDMDSDNDDREELEELKAMQMELIKKLRSSKGEDRKEIMKELLEVNKEIKELMKDMREDKEEKEEENKEDLEELKELRVKQAELSKTLKTAKGEEREEILEELLEVKEEIKELMEDVNIRNYRQNIDKNRKIKEIDVLKADNFEEKAMMYLEEQKEARERILEMLDEDFENKEEFLNVEKAYRKVHARSISTMKRIRNAARKNMTEDLKESFEELMEKDREVREKIMEIKKEFFEDRVEALEERLERLSEIEDEEREELYEELIDKASDKKEAYKKIGLALNKTEKDKLKIFVKNRRPSFDADPIVKEGRTLVPVRAISEMLDAEVKWDAETESVIIKKGEKEIVLPINKRKIRVNGEEKETEVAAAIEKSRTFVPLRFISENLDAKVGWDDETRMITIDDDDLEEDEE
ncbi:MAG: stalk domain-containing protein [Clostridia bacterium]|jgi:hypothetical protein|nr:stalk domain-containing protein [Clostridia bacterium]